MKVLFLLSRNLCTHLFFHQSQEEKRERGGMSKQCQKLRSKVKESFVKLVNILSKSIHIYIYIYIYIYTLYHVAFGHFILSTVLFSLQITIIDLSLFDVAFCLIFTIQHILTIFFFLNLALNLSSFCLLLCSFTVLPPHFRVNFRVKLIYTLRSRKTVLLKI